LFICLFVYLLVGDVLLSACGWNCEFRIDANRQEIVSEVSSMRDLYIRAKNGGEYLVNLKYHRDSITNKIITDLNPPKFIALKKYLEFMRYKGVTEEVTTIL